MFSSNRVVTSPSTSSGAAPESGAYHQHGLLCIGLEFNNQESDAHISKYQDQKDSDNDGNRQFYGRFRYIHRGTSQRRM